MARELRIGAVSYPQIFEHTRLLPEMPATRRELIFD